MSHGQLPSGSLQAAKVLLCGWGMDHAAHLGFACRSIWNVRLVSLFLCVGLFLEATSILLNASTPGNDAWSTGKVACLQPAQSWFLYSTLVVSLVFIRWNRAVLLFSLFWDLLLLWSLFFCVLIYLSIYLFSFCLEHHNDGTWGMCYSPPEWHFHNKGCAKRAYGRSLRTRQHW